MRAVLLQCCFLAVLIASTRAANLGPEFQLSAATEIDASGSQPAGDAAAPASPKQRDRGRDHQNVTCPLRVVNMLKTTSSFVHEAKLKGSIHQACGHDSGCYERCFCASVSTAEAVLKTSHVSRTHPAWRACMKQTWTILVKPQLPKKARHAWRHDTCTAAPQCNLW